MSDLAWDRISTGAPPSGAPPIFIVGSPRSGTSLLRRILDSHPAIACGPETHVLADLDDSLGRHWDRLARYGAEKEYWHGAYREAFLDYVRDAYRGRFRRGAGRSLEDRLGQPYATLEAQLLSFLKGDKEAEPKAPTRPKSGGAIRTVPDP